MLLCTYRECATIGRRGLWASVPLAVVMCLSLTGCPEIGTLASSTKLFTLEDAVTLNHPVPGYFDAATEVGKSLGYEVSGISRSTGQIQFTKAATQFTTMMIGKMDRTTVTLELSKDQKTIEIKVVAEGNFDAASQGTVSKIVGDFKSGLSSRLGA